MKKITKSPLAPDHFPALLPVPGVEIGAAAAGLRYKDRPDLMLARLAESTQAAGVFTRSKTPAAPIDWCREGLTKTGGAARALVVNAGNANAFTGNKGRRACEKTAKHAASLIGCQPEEVMVASTGVIGVPLDVSSFPKFLKRILGGLSEVMWGEAAHAITTTDTFPKGSSQLATVAGKPVVITGITKGSGMIAPDMATMLGFIFTNAKIGAGCLNMLLRDMTDKSFNSITVDSDTSTNDCALLFATGVGGNDEMINDPNDPALKDFKAKLLLVMQDLAKQIVRDGEGATKFVTVKVEGAEDDTAARVIAKSIANSPLVKTAIAGEDANWGRIVAAVGKSGERAERDKLKLWIGGQLVAERGGVSRRYVEAQAAEHMRGQEVDITVHVGVGKGEATVWTCDLTHGYIEINGDYRS